MTDITRAYTRARSLEDIPGKEERAMLGNRCLGFATLAIDANTENVQTGTAFSYCINGIMYTKAAVAEIDVSALAVIDEAGDTTTMSAQATATDRWYLLVVNSAGTIKVVQGQAVASGGDCLIPGCPEDYAPFGAVKVENATGSDFTFGTTGLDTANITDTYMNLSVVPAGAQ